MLNLMTLLPLVALYTLDPDGNTFINRLEVTAIDVVGNEKSNPSIWASPDSATKLSIVYI